MITKFIDAKGTERPIDSIANFIAQVESGVITDSTMIYCGDTSSWNKASAVEDYLSIKSRLKNAPKDTPKHSSPYVAMTGQQSLSAKEKLKKFFTKRSTPWVFTGIAIVLLYYSESVLTVGDKGDATGRIAYLTGKYLVILLIGGAIAQKTLFRNFKPSNFISFATVLLGAAIIHTFIAYEDKQAAKSFAKEIAPYLSESGTPADSKTNHSTTSLSPTARNLELSKDLVKQHLEAQAAAANAYTAAVEQLPSVLEPQTIANKAQAQAAMQNVDKFEEAVYAYFDRLEKIQARTREKVKSLATDEQFKSEFISGMDKSSKASAPLLERFKKNQLALARKFREILSFASKTNIQLSAANQPLFATDAEIDYYNAMIEEVQKLAAEEEQITKEILTEQEANRRKLEMMAK